MVWFVDALLLSWRRGWDADSIECARESRRDREWIAAFDVAPFHHELDLAVAQQRDRGRRRRIPGEVTPRLLRGFQILPRENRRQNFRPRFIRERFGNRRTRL